jgi:hypothetical protein
MSSNRPAVDEPIGITVGGPDREYRDCPRDGESGQHRDERCEQVSTTVGHNEAREEKKHHEDEGSQSHICDIAY